MAAILVEECGVPLSPSELVAQLDCLLPALLPSCGTKPGAQELVLYLNSQRVPLCIATSSRKVNMKKKMKGHQEMFDCFDHKVYGSDDPEVGRGKPYPDIFTVAASRFDPPPASPENCLVIEDSLAGVEAGLMAGMQVVMVPEGSSLQEAEALPSLGACRPTVIDSLEQFVPENWGLPPWDREQD